MPVTNHSFLWVTVTMGAKLKRKSFFVDENALRHGKKALGAKTDAEVVRMSVERIAEMEEFWRFMKKSRHALKPGSLGSHRMISRS